MATIKKSDVAPSAAAVFKTIDNKLNDPGGGCSTALDRLEQMSWILFLHYLDEQEKEREAEAELSGEPYAPILPKKLRWSSWAWPTKPNGAFDLDQTLKGDELLEFVKGTLFKGLKELHDTAAPDSEAYKVGEIFSELTCRFQSGYTLREVINLIEPMKFQTDEDRHELTVLYEDRLNDMGNAGRNGGQYSAGVKAVVLFFKKGGKTTKPIHYYELDLKGVSLGKTRPLRESDLAEFEQMVTMGQIPNDCTAHWTIDPASVDKTTYDLSVRNPNIEEEKLPSSKECLKRLNALNLGIAELLAKFTEKN